MENKIYISGLVISWLTSQLFDEIIIKGIASIVTLLIATTIAFFYKRWLEEKFKK
jgi:positive regulator of sigma E activity